MRAGSNATGIVWVGRRCSRERIFGWAGGTRDWPSSQSLSASFRVSTASLCSAIFRQLVFISGAGLGIFGGENSSGDP